MNTDIETIISYLGKQITENNSAGQMKASDSSSSQNKNAEQNKKNKSNDAQTKSTQKEQQAGQANANPSMQLQKSWQTLQTKSMDIHMNWNKVESEAIKAGMSVAERNDFKVAMENLTVEISNKDKIKSMKAAVELYGQYGNLAKVFNTTIPADYYKTKYDVMASGIEAMEGEWDKAGERMTRLKDDWNSLKMQAKDLDEKLLNRSDLSMDDFAAAVAGKNKELLIIKAQIVMANLQQIEKSLAKSKNRQ